MHSSLSFVFSVKSPAGEAEIFVFSATFFLSDSESEEFEEELTSGKTAFDFTLSIDFFENRESVLTI